MGHVVVGFVDGIVGVALPFAVLASFGLVAWAGLGSPSSWTPFVQGAAVAWLLGHGVDVRFAAGGDSFTVTAAALGPALVTALCAVRAGRRAARTADPVASWAAGLLATALASGGLLVVASSPSATPTVWQAFVLPSVLVAGCSLVALRGARSGTPPIGDGLRAGVAAAALVLAAAGILVAVLLGTHLPEVVGLYESLAAGIAGGLALTAAQILLLPTAVIWAASWCTGAGVSLGTGSTTGPLGTQIGPLPALPLLGALPADPGRAAVAALLIPIGCGLVAGFLARRRGSPVGSLRLGATTGLVAGAALGALVAASAGSAGPGRFAVAGPDPMLVAGLAALEIGLAAMLGAAAAKPIERDEPAERTDTSTSWEPFGEPEVGEPAR